MTKRILLADDDADDRMLFQEVFSEMPLGQYELTSFSNGEEIMNHLKGLKDPILFPNLIILDQNMPILSGKETLLKLKASALYNQIPVIIYSTYNDKSFMEECAFMGANAVVSKPDSFEGFVEMINNFLEYSNGRNSVSANN